jgi:hypothetical protein
LNLGQLTLVIAALSLLGVLVLQSNSVILDSSRNLTTTEIDAAATALATSLLEEASGKLFDEVITDSMVTALSSTSLLSSTLGRESGERYRDSIGTYSVFDDFDDFDGLFVVYKSDQPGDAVPTPGADWEFVVPEIRGKFYVHADVQYVHPPALDVPVHWRTWHKMLSLTVTSPTSEDTLVYSSMMSFWN